jgi:Regulator of chromosome condensation (RCC1) repeat
LVIPKKGKRDIMLIRTHLGFRSLTLLGFAGMLYSGCVSSAPPKPTNAAGAGGNDGSAAAPNSASGTAGAEAGEAGNAGQASDASGAATSSGGTHSGIGGTTSGSGGTAGVGDAGMAGDIGLGGAGDSSAVGGTGGTAGKGGTAGSGGNASACGDLSDPCCSGNTCNDGLTCLSGATCSCAQALFGRYILRTDGNLLYEQDGTAGAQTPVLSASTGMPLPGVQSVIEGTYHGCALLADQTVWCWRSSAQGNAAGQLGAGTTDSSGPVFRATQVLTGATKPLTGVTALSSLDASNSDSSCAIAGAAGNIYCWGDTAYELNGGTALTSPYATEVTLDGVTALTGAVHMAIDGWQVSYVCSIINKATANEVWCWGANGNGNLGTGDTTDRKYPTKVVGISNPTQVVPFGHWDDAYGYAFTTCVIDGPNVRCWGNNSGGEVGNGTTNSPILSPALVTLTGGTTALTGIVDLRATAGAWNISTYACGLATDHTVKCWGQGFALYPENYNVANVVALGNLDGDLVRLLSSDGLYHIGATTRAPNCGLLQ